MAAVGSRRETRAKHEEAARLRACGRSWQEIAEKLGYRSRQGAQTAVARFYARTRETPEFSRRSLTEGLRIVHQLLFEELADAKRRHNQAAIVAVSRELRATADQMAKLDGLHAPSRTEVNVRIESSATAVLDRAQAELLAIAEHSCREHDVIDA